MSALISALDLDPFALLSREDYRTVCSGLDHSGSAIIPHSQKVPSPNPLRLSPHLPLPARDRPIGYAR
jgi:hypothetical protein